MLEKLPPELEIQLLEDWYKTCKRVIEDNDGLLKRLELSYLPDKDEMIRSSKEATKDCEDDDGNNKTHAKRQV